MLPDVLASRPMVTAAGWLRAEAALILLLVGLVPAACGKKGPPLAPIVKTPAPLSDFTARRSGDTVYLRLTVPSGNTDNTKPADISRVEVYAYTALKEIEGLEVRDLTLVSEVLVRRPPDPEADRDVTEKPAATKKPAKEKPPEPGVDQGAVITITEVLTPETMAPTPIPRRLIKTSTVTTSDPSQGSRLELPVGGPVLEARLRRFYLAYAVNRSGERGNPSPRFAVAFDALPPPPGRPRLAVNGKVLEISWDPPVGAAAAIERPGAAPLLPAAPRGMLLPVLPLYNIYAVSRSSSSAETGGSRPAELPLPLNLKPLSVPSFVDDKIEFGVERCYQVRTVNTVGATTQVTTGTALTAPPAGVAPLATPAIAESAPSPIACVTPADRVPPPAPTALAAVASTGAISLIWTGVDAPDLAGYLVLRSATPDGPFTALFKAPITETTYRDTSVTAGVRYVYAVVAIDRASPPNQSAMSNKTEETAR
ncbi:MAG: hypothetical protein NTV05_17835 [Acidobacteria bacterium]|nr:hypothetical protein [Acidobacteriota bacterium]